MYFFQKNNYFDHRILHKNTSLNLLKYFTWNTFILIEKLKMYFNIQYIYNLFYKSETVIDRNL